MKIISTKNAPQAIGPYSQAIAHQGVLYCSGQIALGADGSDHTQADIQTQTRLTLENLKGVLEAGGSDLEHVLKVSIFLADMADFQQVNEIYATFFPLHRPARACVAVRTLPKNARIEIECIAALINA